MNFYFNGITPDTYAEMSFVQYSNVYDYYLRDYKKAPSIIAEVGGALNALLIIAGAINYYLHLKSSQIQIFEIYSNKIAPKGKSDIKKENQLLKLLQKD